MARLRQQLQSWIKATKATLYGPSATLMGTYLGDPGVCQHVSVFEVDEGVQLHGGTPSHLGIPVPQVQVLRQRPH